MLAGTRRSTASKLTVGEIGPQPPFCNYPEFQRKHARGVEPDKTIEMIEKFATQCCAVWRLVASFNPRGPKGLSGRSARIIQRGSLPWKSRSVSRIVPGVERCTEEGRRIGRGCSGELVSLSPELSMVKAAWRRACCCFLRRSRLIVRWLVANCSPAVRFTTDGGRDDRE